MSKWTCPQGKPYLQPIQVVETAHPEGRPHLTLPLHSDGTLCGPWCQDIEEKRKRASYCDGSGGIRRYAPGEYGPGTLIGRCKGCPRCIKHLPNEGT